MRKSSSESREVQPLFIRRRNLPEYTGLSASSIHRLEAAGQFPPRRRLGPGCVGWKLDEILAWAEDREQV